MRKSPVAGRLFLILLPVLLSRNTAKAQTPRDALMAQAKQNANAMVKHDYETVVRFTYPPIVEQMGGFKKAVDTVSAVMANIEAKGLVLESITVGKPSAIVVEGREDVAIVPTEMVMRAGTKDVFVSSYLVAVSQNQGRKWYFLDGASFPKEKLARIYPKLVSIVEIPVRKNSLEEELKEMLRGAEKNKREP